MSLPGSTHAPLRTAARTPTLATRRGGLAAKDTQRAAALRGWLRLRWPLRYAYSTHTGSSREGRRNCLIPRALAMVVALTLLGTFLEREAQ